jgi:hypothetical protein
MTLRGKEFADSSVFSKKPKKSEKKKKEHSKPEEETI